MERNFQEKRADSNKRREKPILMIVAEGNNVTESTYFKSFQRQHANYNIKMIIAKSITDPKGLLKEMQRQWKDKGLSEDKGDMAYIVLDLDCDNSKAKLIKSLSGKTKNIKFVPSNPCFEVWFLLHFKYSTHSYNNSSEVIRELKTFIPNYEKTKDINCTLCPLLEVALENANRLSDHYQSLEMEWPSNDCNPMTEVPVIINKIKELDK